MSMIWCYDALGNRVSIAREAVTFCPAVYGIFIEHEQVMLLRHSETQLWQPLGEILAPHETPTQAIRHYFRRVAGLIPRLGPLLYVEDQFRVETDGRAWHLSILYYALDRLTVAATTLTDIQQNQPEWVPLDELQRHDLQFGYEAIQAGRLRLSL